MTPKVPAHAYCMICILNEDIYNKESWNYVFGLASTKNWIGVFSFARYSPSFWGKEESDEEESKMSTSELMVYWSSKTMCHEIGHMFGILHCTYYNCLMNGSMNAAEGKIKPFYFCIICLKKLQYMIGFDLLVWSEAISKAFEINPLFEKARQYHLEF